MQNGLFTTIHTEGGILPQDILLHIAQLDKSLDYLSVSDYGLLESEKINEVINISWNRLQSAWKSFQTILAEDSDRYATSITREKWLLILFQELGYGRLETARAIDLDGKSFAISHKRGSLPIHLVGWHIPLDKKSEGVKGASRISPHGMVQELLNKSDEYLWGMVSNGRILRLLRDNVNLTKQAYVEFDLEAMMNGEVYSDFTLLWTVCHVTRFDAQDNDPEKYVIEKWSQEAKNTGIRLLDNLRNGVENAINKLGTGFISNSNNESLRNALRTGELTREDYYRQLLRLVYRLLFIFTAEDRNVLLDPQASSQTKELYYKYYSTNRIRNLAGKRSGSKHCDLYESLKIIMHGLSSSTGCPELGLPALGSFLWSSEAIPFLENAYISNEYLLDAVRSLSWTTDGQNRRVVDYRNLGSEELGSVYESLLELVPEVDLSTGKFNLYQVAGNDRKSSGSYYTPTSLINQLLDTALEPVLKEALNLPDQERALLDIRVCDPACGSGHFLVAAAHRIAKKLAYVRSGEEEPSIGEQRNALRDVISNCIYGVDINEMAVELCKISLWLEALEPGKPLSYLDSRIKCGNSLLGATPKLLEGGIPDEAFVPLTGDDRKVASFFKKLNKQEREQQTSSLFAKEVPTTSAYEKEVFEKSITRDQITANSINEIERKQLLDFEIQQSKAYLSLKQQADAYCSAYFWPLTHESILPITQGMFREISKVQDNIEAQLRKQIIDITNENKFFHWHLEFPEIFMNNNKQYNVDTGWYGGFSVVLGNPPWERVKLQEVEWFSAHSPEIAKAINKSERSKMINNLKTSDPDLYDAFQKAKRHAGGLSHYITNSSLYPLCGRGDINTYAIFAELNRYLISELGLCGCIVPSGILTDDTYKYFFQDLINNNMLISAYDFENRKGLFPAIDSRIKFVLLTMSGKSRINKNADFVFFAQEIDDIKDKERHFTMSKEEINLVNPNTKTCPVFRSNRDKDIVMKIYEKFSVLIKEDDPAGNPWGVEFTTMFHMSNDSYLFKTKNQLLEESWSLQQGNVFEKNEDVYLPLYEGKLINQFDSKFTTYIDDKTTINLTVKEKQDPNVVSIPRYWVPKEEVDKKLEGKWNNDWVLGYREITNSTNERTLICSLLPRYAFNNKLPLIFFSNSNVYNGLCLLAFFNSFLMDYIVRTKLNSTSLSYYYLKQLPVPTPEMVVDSSIYELLISTTKLIYQMTNPGFVFNRDQNINYDYNKLLDMRAKIDASIFLLYGIEINDVKYIMDTFVISKAKDITSYGNYYTSERILYYYNMLYNK